jgi:hypothetical protein
MRPREIKPATSKIGLLANMRNPDGTMQRGDAEAQATTLGITLLPSTCCPPITLKQRSSRWPASVAILR